MSTPTYEATTIMVRARLTEAEWVALRQLAIGRKRPVADLVADALRQIYNLNGEKK